MEHVYAVSGLTCKGCEASVKDKLLSINDVENVDVSLEKKEVKIKMERYIPIEILQGSLSDKYKISLQQDFEK